MDDVYKNIERKILIDFDDMIADRLNNKKLNKIITNLSITWRKLNIALVFITHSYLTLPKIL